MDSCEDLSNLTIVIPSRNRREKLHALLSYFNVNYVQCSILLLVSSKNKNYVAKKEYPNLNIDILEFDENLELGYKIHLGLKRVTTELTAICADNDLVLLDGINESVKFLADNPDYSAAQGYNAQFAEEGDKISFHSIPYFTPSIEGSEPVDRLIALMRRYNPICWAVWRTEILQEFCQNSYPYNNIIFTELLWSATAAIRGKVKRLPILYCLRRIDGLQMMGHPFFAMMQSPSNYICEYVRHRNKLVDMLNANCRYTVSQLERIIDTLHYFLQGVSIEPHRVNIFLDVMINNPDVSIFDKHINPILQLPAPVTSEGWEKEIIFEGKKYRFFPEFLRPEPRDEVSLPDDFETALISNAHHYFAVSPPSPLGLLSNFLK